MKRIWRSIPDFEEYQVSNDGMIRRNGREVKPTTTASGQLRVYLYKGGLGTRISIKNIVEAAFGLDHNYSEWSVRVPAHDWVTLESADVTDITNPFSSVFEMFPDNSKEPYRILATRFKVSVQAIYSLRHGAGWTRHYKAHHSIK